MRLPAMASALPALIALLVGWLLVFVPCTSAFAEATGAALIQRFECQRCHDGTGAKEVRQDKHCLRCHQAILSGRFVAPKEALTRWQSHIKSIVEVPSLVAAGKRYDRAWIESFLLAPHDLRPAMIALMPRLALTKEETGAIASYFAKRDGGEAPKGEALVPPDQAKLDEGRKLLFEKGCMLCHKMTGLVGPSLPVKPPVLHSSLPLSKPGLIRGITLAPDLSIARVRLRQKGAELVSWLLDPRSQKKDAVMPRLALTPKEAETIAAFVLYAPLAKPEPLPPEKRLPPLERRVSFDEVNERVFRRTCWHCHSTPEYAMGDGGPGNTGGFGFPGRGLNFTNYTSVASGSLDDAGNRRSLFLPLADGTPRLLAHLLARQSEMAGRVVPGIRGMPLGLPALSKEEIQLVESWIVQGRPQ